MELVTDADKIDRFERLVNNVALARLEFRHLPIFAQVCLFYSGNAGEKTEIWDEELTRRAFEDGKKMLAAQSSLNASEMDGLFTALRTISELSNFGATFASNAANNPNSPRSEPASPASVGSVDAWSVEATLDICEGKYSNLLDMFAQAVDRSKSGCELDEYWLKELVNHVALKLPLDSTYINYLAELSHFRMTSLLKTTKLESWVQANNNQYNNESGIDKTTLGFALLCAQLRTATNYMDQLEVLAGREKAQMTARVLKRFDETGDFGNLVLTDNPDDPIFSLVPKQSHLLLFDRLTLTGLQMFFLLANDDDYLAVRSGSGTASRSLAMHFLEAVRSRTKTVRTSGSEDEAKEVDEVVDRFVLDFVPFWRATANFYYPTQLQMKMKSIS